jgi:toluene monooxygenase system protein E
MMPEKPRTKPPSKLKTYSHLTVGRRVPTEYEIVTSQLHWYVRAGFAVNVPLADWYARYQRGSPLTHPDWEKFTDPRETTYTRYVETREAREAYVAGVLQAIENAGTDASLGPAWQRTLGRAFLPLRFPFHGLQMVAAYVGQMAPSGRITITAMFQAADEVRRIQHIAYRMAQIATHVPGFGDDSRALWEEQVAWQPMRECIERLLVAWDWGEALVGLGLCVKPILDDVTMLHLPAVAAERGDPSLRAIGHSLLEDCKWHREWTAALLRMAIEEHAENRDVVRGWVRVWAPRALRAAEAWATLLDAPSPRALLEAGVRERLAALGLESP